MKPANQQLVTPFYCFETELWAENRNVLLGLNRFEALDKPIVARGGNDSPDSYRAISPSVYFDGEKFVMWYVGIACSRPINSTQDWFDQERHSLCVAYSNNGIDWEKPRIKNTDAVFFPGSNALFDDKLLLAGVDYIQEKDIFAMAYTYHNGSDIEPAATVFSMAFSRDGIKWERDFKPASHVKHFESCVGSKRIGDKYWIIGQGISPYFVQPDGSRCMRAAFGYYSSNLKDWKCYRYPLFHYELDSDYFKANPLMSYQTHLGFTAWPRKRINLGFVGHFFPASPPLITRFNNGLIYSRDGLAWHEPFPLQPVLAAPEVPYEDALAGKNMPDDSWFVSVIQGNTLMNHEDKTYFWFTGGYGLGYSTQADKYEIGLATMRRDGFAHFTAEKAEECLLVTEPITLGKTDETIYLNADADVRHPLRIRVLDKYFEPIDNAAFDLTRSGVMEKCGINLKQICSLTKEIRLRFEWEGGENRFYMFNIGPDLDVDEYMSQWQ